MATAIVSDIVGFSTHDGPGIRTTVFLKGCPLRCKWCSNPETFTAEEMICFIPTRCTGCDRCRSRCPGGLIGEASLGYQRIDRTRCDRCGKCVEACLSKALTVSGKKYSTEEVFHRILRDQPFYGKEGGLTLSGGEPLLNSDFTKELFGMCRQEGINTVLDTTGYGDTEKLKDILKDTDMVLLDIKHMNDEEHIKWTGVSNKLILKNAEIIASMVETRVSLPLVPDANSSAENLTATAEFLNRIGVKHVDINPLHKFAEGKYHYLGMESPYDELRTPEKHEVEAAVDIFRKHGIVTGVGRMM